MALFRVIPDGDVLIEGGRVQLTSTLTEYVKVKIRQRLRFFLGEWVLDRRKGIPYLRSVIAQPYTNPNAVRAVLRAVVLSIPEVAGLPDFDIDFSPTERRLGVSFTATLADGSPVVSQADDDFVFSF